MWGFEVWEILWMIKQSSTRMEERFVGHQLLLFFIQLENQIYVSMDELLCFIMLLMNLYFSAETIMCFYSASTSAWLLNHHGAYTLCQFCQVCHSQPVHFLARHFKVLYILIFALWFLCQNYYKNWCINWYSICYSMPMPFEHQMEYAINWGLDQYLGIRLYLPAH